VQLISTVIFSHDFSSIEAIIYDIYSERNRIFINKTDQQCCWSHTFRLKRHFDINDLTQALNHGRQTTLAIVTQD